MKKVLSILKLLRVKHYIKNILVFLPLIFSSNLLNYNKLVIVILAFIVFSFTSSIIYIINDIRDKEKDKNHEVKKFRPIASGDIKVKEAIIIAIILFIINLLILISINKLFDISSIVLIAYLIINILYSLGLKNIPIVDVTIVSIGFVLRVLYGGLIVDITVSSWLFYTILSISFYMALGKRRNELIKSDKLDTRDVLKHYNKDFLDKNMYMFQTLSIVFYSLWSILGTNNVLFRYSVIIVILLLMKYSMNLENDSSGDPVDVILGDKILILLGIIYVVLMLFAFYI